MYLVPAFVLGFISSLHCVGMCGPIVLALPVPQANPVKRLVAMLVNNSGRLLTYGLLGLLIGTFGNGFYVAGVQQVFSILIGAGVIAFAVIPATWKNKLQEAIPLVKKTGEVFRNTFSHYLRKEHHSAYFIAGMLHGLLPCGLVYFALAGAILTSSAISAALFMVFFGLGTMPALLSLRWMARVFPYSIRTKVYRIMPVFLFFTGVLLLLRGLNLGIPYVSPHFPGSSSSIPVCYPK